MDEKALARLPLAARVIAQDAILAWAIDYLRRLLDTQPDDARSRIRKVMKLKLDAAREDFLRLTFPEVPPEQSDAAAGEFQDAFDYLVRKLEESLGLPK